MSQQKQAPLPRQEFQEWLENAAVPVLVLQKGKHLGSVVKVPATPEIDYLFGCETFYGERISWSDRLEFCGLYDRQHQALHLLDDPLPNFVSGLTEEECQDSTAFGKRIAQEVDRYVEAAISNERSRLSVRELTSERNINSYRYYKGTEAGREAASLVFSGEKPDVQFHSEYYTSLTEDTLLSYLKSPEDYIKTTAEQYMRDNQEEFLAQFLKKDALLAEYRITFTAQLRRMGTDMVADDLRALLSEVGQTYALMAALEARRYTPTGEDLTAFRDGLAAQQGQEWPGASNPARSTISM